MGCWLSFPPSQVCILYIGFETYCNYGMMEPELFNFCRSVFCLTVFWPFSPIVSPRTPWARQQASNGLAICIILWRQQWRSWIAKRKYWTATCRLKSKTLSRRKRRNSKTSWSLARYNVHAAEDSVATLIQIILSTMLADTIHVAFQEDMFGTPQATRLLQLWCVRRWRTQHHRPNWCILDFGFLKAS